MSYGFRRTGYQRIVGYDRIVGADPQSAAAYQQESYRRTMRGAGVALPMNSGAPQVISGDEGPLREFPMGFLYSTVGKSAQVTVNEKPQVTFRGSRLVLPETVDAIANPFKLNDLKIGQRSQFVSATRIPAATFFTTGVGVALSLDTCTTGQDISLVVTNSDAAATHDFEAALIGTCALPG